jgi:hypothetical protein
VYSLIQIKCILVCIYFLIIDSGIKSRRYYTFWWEFRDAGYRVVVRGIAVYIYLLLGLF